MLKNASVLELVEREYEPKEMKEYKNHTFKRGKSYYIAENILGKIPENALEKA